MQKSIFIDTLKGIKRERPPVWFMRQAGRVLPSYQQLREFHSFKELMLTPELAAEVTLLPVYDLGVDAAILFSDILVVPEAMGMELNFTPFGPVFKKPLTEIKNPIESLIPDTGKLEHVYKTLDIIKKIKPADVALIGFCGAPLTTFCYMVQGNSHSHTFSKAVDLIYNDRKLASEIFGMLTEMSIEYAVNQAIHGIDAFQLFDTHAGLIPSELYIDFVLPYVKKISDAVRAKNIPFIFFPKGLGLAISKIDFDIADYVSVDWQFSLSEVRKILDTKVGVQGNFDQRFLSTKNKKILENELCKFIEFGQIETKWIFNTGHGLLPENTIENVIHTVEWIKKTDWKRK